MQINQTSNTIKRRDQHYLRFWQEPKYLLFFILGFHLVLLLVYFFGPVSYVSEQPSLLVVVYVLGYLLAFFFGTLVARNYYVNTSITQPSPSLFLIISSVVVLMFFVPTLLLRSGLTQGATLGEIYATSLEARGGGGTFIEYGRIPFGIFFIGLQPVLVAFWNDFSFKLKVIGVFSLVATLVLGVVYGINKPLFDFFTGLVILWLSGVWRLRLNWSKKIISFILAVIMVLALGIYFTETQLTREGSPLVTGYDSRTQMNLKYSAADGPVYAFYSGMSAYLVQGYRAFDLALHEDFEFTFGVGNSIFASRQIDRILDTDISERTYPAKIEKYGWDRMINWSSFYVWWASDLHFFGVFFLMLLLGIIWKLALNTLYYSKRILFAIIFFYNLTIGLFYLSANNQLFQSGESYFATLASIFLFLGWGKVSRKNKRT